MYILQTMSILIALKTIAYIDVINPENTIHIRVILAEERVKEAIIALFKIVQAQQLFTIGHQSPNFYYFQFNSRVKNEFY